MNGNDFLKSKWMEEAKKMDVEKFGREKFGRWSNRVQNTGILSKAKELWDYIVSGRVSGTEKLVVLAALLYIISPIDLIPDFIPVVGWLDDLGIGAFALTFITGKLSNAALSSPIAGTDEIIPNTKNVAGPPLKGFQYKSGISYKIDELKYVAYNLEAPEMVAYAEDIEERLDSTLFNVMFVGRYNSGKSTLINAFLGKEYLPSAATATRRPITYIMMGNEEKLYSENLQGTITVHKNVNELLDTGNKYLEEASQISLFLPAALLTDQLCFVDTPGLEDPNQDFSNMTLQAAPAADALVMVIHIGYTQAAADWKFLKDMLHDDRDRKVFVVLNHADRVNQKEMDQVLKTIREPLRSLNIPESRIFSLSAKNACENIFANAEPADDFTSFKTNLLNFLNQSRKIERERIISQQVGVLSNKLSDTCRTYVGLQEKNEEERKSKLEQLANERRQADRLLDNEERKVDRKIHELENKFLANFEDFSVELRTHIQRYIDHSTLPQLQADYELANTIKTKIREFIENNLKDIHQELGNFTYGCINNLHSELQKTNFSIELERDQSIIRKNPEFLVLGGMFIAWPFLGLMSFAALATGMFFGRNYLEDMITKIIDKQGKEKARKIIMEQLDGQLASFKKDIKPQIEEHFKQLRNDSLAKMKSSLMENIGAAYTVAQVDLAGAGRMAEKARQLLPRCENPMQ